MKYVRTKDNRICKIISEAKEDFWKNYNIAMLVENNEGKFYLIKEELEGSRQADTLEELSDCFVAVDKNGNLCENPMIAKGHCFKSFCNYYRANKIDVDCYLAILTGEGLIFVAKMNEKGELEVL